MRLRNLFIALVVFAVLVPLTHAEDRKAVQNPPKVKISIDGFPLSLDVLKTQAPVRRVPQKYHAEGVAWVEGSEIQIAIAPGFKLPDGGLVVDSNTRLSKELIAALRLPSSAKLIPDVYKGTVYYPEQPGNPNAREIVITGGVKGGSGGWEASATVSIKFGK